MDFKIQKLDQKHRNYADPINARWYCELNGVEYFNRTQEGLRECVERMLDIQKNGPKKPEPRRGSSASQTGSEDSKKSGDNEDDSSETTDEESDDDGSDDADDGADDDSGDE